MKFEQFCTEYRERVDQVLAQQLYQGNGPTCDLLDEAMEYALLAGGKRIRPLLCYATGMALGAKPEHLDIAAASLEMLHTYSLVHDDLPAMDDDDLRRGQPSCHAAFDEATAILAGDALHALAFESLSGLVQSDLPASYVALMLKVLAEAAGKYGMCAGQSLDLAAQDRLLSLNELENMHRLKTGALIRASVRLGALCAQMAEPQLMQQLDEYADAIGLAFQIQDDILDATQDSGTLGKTAGKDAAQNKVTYVTLLGLETARAKAEREIDRALAVLAQLDLSESLLTDLAQLVLNRTA